MDRLREKFGDEAVIKGLALEEPDDRTAHDRGRRAMD